MLLLSVLTIVSGLLASGAAVRAHPHVFIDTGIEMLFDPDGQLSDVRVIWAYDDFTSMLIFADFGLDPDGDGVLTAPELAKLDGFDMQWIEGFEGDTYLLAGDQQVGLGPPRDHTTAVVAGRIVTSHLRAVVPPQVTGVPLVVKAYDPSYYSAYSITLAPVIHGREDCAPQVFGPDLTAAEALLEAELARSTDPETEFPEVGEAFAEELRVTCAGG